MKGKELLIREYMDEGKFDFGIFTETWLEEKDQQWIEGCALNNHGYRLVHHDRKHKRGGGIALTYKEWIKAKHIDCGEKDTFEFLSAHLTLCTTTITILCIYHPQASTVNQTSNSRFIDEFLEFLTTFVPAHDNILIGGDFNLHIGDKHDLDAEVFSESMESLGFIQHVKFETHNKGNVLDLIMTEEHSSVKIKECNPGPFLSDHCCIEVDCGTKKGNVTSEMITCRRLKNLDINEFCSQLQDFSQIVDLEELVSRFSENLKEALDTLAPETTKERSSETNTLGLVRKSRMLNKKQGVGNVFGENTKKIING